MTAEEATTAHGVVPTPYRLDESVGGIRIRHRPFNALLPGVYADIDGARKALATLLLGGVLAGEGEFEYRGQPMTLQAGFDLSALPARPTLDVSAGSVSAGYGSLPDFHDGLPPLSADIYASLKASFDAWCGDKSAATALVMAGADDLWRDVAGYGIATLNDPASEVPDYLADDAAELRRLYPELSMLNDGSLCDWFDSYSSDCSMVRGWTPFRDDDFLFYLVGAVATAPNKPSSEARDAGMLAGFALLRGRTVHEALDFGASASRYDTAIRSMAVRAREAVAFLVEDAGADRNRGPAVRTFNDTFRMARKFNPGPLMVSQQSLAGVASGDKVAPAS